METIYEVASRLQGAYTFSILDTASGFWQLKVDEESSCLCTFNTPIGPYRLTRLSFGVTCALEIFQRTMDRIVEDLDGVEVIMDDVIVAGDETTHDERLQKFLERASNQGLKFNKEKCKIRQRQAPYEGHLLTSEGLKIDPQKVKAVEEMSEPQSKEDMKRLLGLVQFLSRYLPSLFTVDAPLMDILLDYFMSQQVLEPTREKNNILDLVITTNEGLIRNLRVGELLSDHNSIVFEVKMSSSKNPSHKKVYKFTKANLDRLNELFNFVPWTCGFLTDDVQENWLMFKDLFFTAVEACIPTKSPRKM